MPRSSTMEGGAGAAKKRKKSMAREEKSAPPPSPVNNGSGGSDLASWWPSPDADFSPHQGGMDPRPPGGFINFLQQCHYPPLPHQFPQFPQQMLPENSHFVGAPAGFAPFSTPIAQGIPSVIVQDLCPPRSASPPPTQYSINLDDDDDAELARAEKRLRWTHEEEVRLANAWIENSNDPINGNCKRNNEYWSQVTATYNNNTPNNRKREVGQLKVHWHRVSTKVNNFNCCMETIKKVYISGRNDPKDDMADALLKYENDYKESFKYLHWWEVLKNEPKWHAYCEMLNRGKKNSSSPKIVLDHEDLPRPMGCTAAKAKHKMPEPIAGLGEELHKFMTAQTAAREDHKEMKEFQLSISSEKLEAAKLAEQAAKEKKQAAEEKKKSKMMDIYKEILLADTSKLDEDAKAERKKALKYMNLQLFGEDN